HYPEWRLRVYGVAAPDVNPSGSAETGRGVGADPHPAASAAAAAEAGRLAPGIGGLGQTTARRADLSFGWERIWREAIPCHHRSRRGSRGTRDLFSVPSGPARRLRSTERPAPGAARRRASAPPPPR